MPVRATTDLGFWWLANRQWYRRRAVELSKRNLRFKVTVSVLVFVLVVGAAGNALYIILLKAVFEKGKRLDHAYLEVLCSRLDRNFKEVFSLTAVCASDPTVLRAAFLPPSAIGDAIRAHDKLTAFLQANPFGSYFEKLIVCSDKALLFAASSRQGGNFSDLELIQTHPLYRRLKAENLGWICGFEDSSTPNNPWDSYVIIFRIRGSHYNSGDVYLYAEISLSIITDVFYEYEAPPGIFALADQTHRIIPWDTPKLGVLPEGIPVMEQNGVRFRQGGRNYRLDRLPLKNAELTLYNQVDVSSLTADERFVYYMAFTALAVSLIAAGILNKAISSFVLRPIYVLIDRIKEISKDRDFSGDPEIEKGGDEFGLIGKTINELTNSIAFYLQQINEYYREQKNAEIALLQTRINPHFLYNTLDAIRWMANIQHTPAIADLSRRLINLMRNIAGNTDADGTKITLTEELQLLEDYTEIMSVRFMGSFEIVNRVPERFLNCRIPKLTLQPLVENAIVHGIDPGGRFTTITLSAFEDGDYLSIVVEDTGVGMSRKQMETIKNPDKNKKRSGPSLNYMGISNVEERLKLMYGESCGLSFESRKGEFTRVKVKILKEQGEPFPGSIRGKS